MKEVDVAAILAGARRRPYTEGMPFKDHFSARAATYAAFRPDYPAALFDRVAALPAARRLAWDCATGSGQAAVPLADRFERVIATDASTEQLANARRDARIEYRVAPAEASGLPTASVDLVTVAQALHWFDVERFFAEARRVLRPSGAIAVWTYGDSALDDPALNEPLQRLAHVTMGAYWPAERALVDDGYRSLPFPFDEVEMPAFVLACEWTLAELAGYLRSWSATARFVAARGGDPIAPFEAELAPLWGGADRRRTVRWPVALRAGGR